MFYFSVTAVDLVQLLFAEFVVDLAIGLRWGKATKTSLSSLTDIFQLKIRWTEVQSCFVRVR
jgi:hypothetical protein